MQDPQYQALGAIATVEDDELGKVKMQNVMFRMSKTPGDIRWAGRRLGEDNSVVYRDELGLTDDELAELTDKGVM
jgi:crotonobetainyl-CoA:carnitine CoA-transferase CaiB-like acyl-CoA transferase